MHPLATGWPGPFCINRGSHSAVAETLERTTVRLHKLNRRLLLLGEHCYLDSSDECYFAGLYECRRQRGIKALVVSLKQGNRSAILDASSQVASALPPDWAQHHTFVPMPASAGDGGAAKAVVRNLPVADARYLLVQKADTRPSHYGSRLAPIQRAALMALDERQADPRPTAVVIVDDVLTTGCHFRAAKMLVRQKWPGMRVIGLFLARACARHQAFCYLEGAGHGNGRACRIEPAKPSSEPDEL